jgi:putative hemolysin
MTELAPITTQVTQSRPAKPPTSARYDKRQLSYAGTFKNPWKAYTIRTLEWFTGKIPLLRLIRKIEKQGVPSGQAFWPPVLKAMGIAINTPQEQIDFIPKTGALVVVANHPHGLVDGMVMAELVGRVRTDYRILTRSLLAGVNEVAEFLIPVPFPHEDDSFNKSLEMREQAMAHLKAGGVVILFPAGAVAHSETFFGRAVEAEWNPFTAKLIHRSKAAVLPIHFQGQNSRWYQIAALLSPTIRQGLLLHEVKHSLNKPQSPIIGPAISPEVISSWSDRPRDFINWLREQTLALGN